MHKGGRFFERLHEVRPQGVFEQCGDRTGAAEFSEFNNFSVVVFADDDIRNTLFQFRNRTSKADDRHDFARDGNAKAIFSRRPVEPAAETDDDAAQFAVVEIDAPLPRNRSRIEGEFVPLVNVVVDKSRDQIVRGGNRVNVAGKM